MCPSFFLLSVLFLNREQAQKNALVSRPKLITRAIVCCGKLRCIDAFNCCRPIKDQDDTTQAPIFDTPKFLFNRLSRILPVFYTCFIMAIVLTPTGHGNQVKNVSFPDQTRVTETNFCRGLRWMWVPLLPTLSLCFWSTFGFWDSSQPTGPHGQCPHYFSSTSFSPSA